jgi:hypothetical protein
MHTYDELIDLTSLSREGIKKFIYMMSPPGATVRAFLKKLASNGDSLRHECILIGDRWLFENIDTSPLPDH